MRDVKQYWQDIRALENTLPEFVWLSAGGQVVEVPASHAARLLHDGSHRLATEEEVDAYRASEDAAKRQAVEDGLKRKGITVVAVRPSR